MSDMIEALLRRDASIADRFPQAPQAVIENAPAPRAWAAGLAEETASFNESLGKTVRVRGDEAVVATGQQPGLLTGPLYTIYKAISAIHWAREAERRWNAPCLPVFWCASDDHDFEEIRTVHLLNKDDEPIELRYAPESAVAGLPAYRIPLEESLHGLIDQAAAEARGSLQAPEVRDFLHESLDASANMAGWFCRIMARLFRETPLTLFAPELPRARKAAAGVLAQEIAAPGESTRRVNAAGQLVEERGFDAQIVKNPGECGYFVEVDGRRRKVVYRDDGYVLPEERGPDGPLRFSVADMQNLLNREPARFSPNAALRPVVQQRLLPVAAYLGGPGEIAYWAQLREVFEQFGESMPAVAPRMRGRLTTLKWQKIQNELGLQADDLDAPFQELVDRALDHLPPTEGRRLVAQHREKVAAPMQALENAAADRDEKDLAPMAAAMRRHAARQLDRMERTAMRADEVRNQAVRERLRRATNALAPWRKPQERVYTVFSFLFEHGWDLVPRMMQRLNASCTGAASSEVHEIEL